ncbi:MAG: hypothetical protein ACYDBQ_09975 [Thermoplasmatota archaeon]
MAHCPTCMAYEKAILALTPGSALPPGVAPCPSFVLEGAAQRHLVDLMRSEMTGTLDASGLNRMGIVRLPGKPPQQGEKERGPRPPPNQAP